MINAVNVPAAASSAPDNEPAADRAETERQAQSPPAPAAPAVVVTISAEGAQRAEVAGSAGTLSSATKVREPADADEDGIVTPKEQAAYDARLAAEKATQAAAEARTPEADAAVKEYVAVEQLGKDGGTAAS